MTQIHFSSDEAVGTLIDPIEPPIAPFEPRDPIPEVITTLAGLEAYAELLREGSGPLALDAERASGYRYSQRAYLVQLRRTGAGTALIDPIPIGNLGPIQQATEGVEWILHAATQDLPCLAEIGLRPSKLFDTELAGRLLGRDRVNLGALVASELGHVLTKGHGSADWSLRPLTSAQLTYAALDVELLIELRDVMEAELQRAGKWEWAQQEFEDLLSFTPKERGEEPWRRTSGLHRLHKPRQRAVVRSLWLARDTLAQRKDIAPGRILADAAISAAAVALPSSPEKLFELKEFSGNAQRRNQSTWWAAVQSAMALPESELPTSAGPLIGPPAPRAWAERDPAAFARLEAARAALTLLATEYALPVENILSPDLVRRLCWEPPEFPETVTKTLQAGGARPWQVALAVGLLEEALKAEQPSTT